MSRLGKQPVALPDGVTVECVDGVVTVTGPKGSLTRTFKTDIVDCTVADGEVTVAIKNEAHPDAAALWGTYASHIRNMVTGVTDGFEKVLEIEGVGYRAEVQGQNLTLNVGYSHPVVFTIPEGLTVTVEKGVITITGFDKEVLGQFAADVRATRPPEPYKGKGIHYRGEYIIRKQGKKAV